MPILYNNNIDPTDRKLLDGLVRRAEATKNLLDMADGLADVIGLYLSENRVPLPGLLSAALENYRATRYRYNK